MKKTVLFTVFLFAFSAFAISDPMPSPCPSNIGANLQDYINLGTTGCTEGNLLFSNFSLPNPQSVGVTVPTAPSIGVTPWSNSDGSGIIFDAALAAGQNQSADVVIDYVVRANAGGAINDSSLSIDAGAFNGGVVSVDETQCLGGLLPGCSGGTSISLNGSANQLTDSNSFADVTLVGISKDIQVSGGPNANGQATVSSEDQFFSTGTDAPEPASLLMFGTGMLGLAFVVRRKKAVCLK
ncbi:MAG TPA: PEP-CTERM sorting domain-containing protein [Terriglobia bacterium]|nr:PEP-CTERM sorting domain-containing protein [Terriglobia bacterium]